jgi:hypothetical protein
MEATIATESPAKGMSNARMRAKTLREVRHSLYVQTQEAPCSCIGPIWEYANYYRAYSTWLLLCSILGGKLSLYTHFISIEIILAPF